LAGSSAGKLVDSKADTMVEMLAEMMVAPKGQRKVGWTVGYLVESTAAW